ncbi:40S ribosomal protein S5-1 [Hordeum vulgare]|nr:40S ribosomal protein S5-1 [Hordeum vulgare]
MVKFLKPGNAVILLQGRYAGKKAVIVRVFEEGTRDRPYGHCLVAGLAKYLKKVTRKDSAKKTAKKSRVKDKIFEKVINPYLTEVLKHPQSIKMSEGMLHIRDVEGPKKTGSVETRLEAMEQQVFKCQGMVERGLNANHMMITEFTSNHKMDAIDIGKHLSRLYDRFDQLQG